MTVKAHIDAAIEGIEELKKGTMSQTTGAVREFSIAITALEDAKMRVTRGIAKREGVFNEVDLQELPGLERAQANHAANVTNEKPGVGRS